MRDVNEILKGSEAASPGPVKVWYHAVVAQIEDAMGDGGDVIVAECEQGIEVCHRWKANAEFVANAWTDVPEMGAEIIRLRALLESLGDAARAAELRVCISIVEQTRINYQPSSPAAIAVGLLESRLDDRLRELEK